jgi:diguanylate cyclase (GGDEF)-like protein
MNDAEHKGLWLLRVHYRMRTAAFAMVFVASIFQLYGQDYAGAAWAYVTALLLVYPQLMHWVALRTGDHIRTAIRLLLVDSLLLGIFCAAVRFSDWLTFSVVLAALINHVANRGWKKCWETLLALATGAALGSVLSGFAFAPRTEWLSVILCALGLTAYVLVVSNIAFYRNAQLRTAREQLRLRERALIDANERLQTSLQEIEVLRKDLAVQASRDPLTNLYNRRHLAAALPREMQRCQREAKPVAVIIMDLDHFKRYNDHYGHAAGDACLKAVAQTIQASAKRASDLAARYGGEEFLLLLPDTDEAEALRMADALGSAVAALDIAHAQSSWGRVTLSLGVAVTRPTYHSDADELLRHADQALYAAKEAGRNRSLLAPLVSGGGQRPLTEVSKLA